MVRADYDEIVEHIGPEIVRENAPMYIGDTERPTHLAIEVLDNSIDELLSDFATQIYVKLDDDGKVTIIDDGRGIPFNNDQPIKLATRLHTSGKFRKNKKSNYKISIGRHGIGLTAVNFLSTSMQIISCRNGKAKGYIFKDGVFKKSVNITPPNNGMKSFTKIIYTPDQTMFDHINVDWMYIRERLILVKMFKPESKIIFNVNGEDVIIPELTLKDLVKTKLYVKKWNDENYFEIEETNKNGEHIKICFYLDFDKLKGEYSSAVNLLPVEKGNHFKIIKNMLYEIFSKDALKNIGKREMDAYFNVYPFILMNNAAFSSQNKKEFQIKPKQFTKNWPNIQKKLKDKLEETGLGAMFVEKLLTYINSKKLKRKTNKKSKTKPLKLKSALNKKNCRLIIVEGDSASGTVGEARTIETDAVLPIKGKILNVADKDIIDIANNKEINELVDVIDEYELDIKQGRYIKVKDQGKYNEVVILTDPDADGYHICILLLNVFKYLMPSVIESGRLYIAVMPLYTASKGKKFIPLYTMDEYQKYKKLKYEIKRHKGLGGFNPNQLEEVMFNNKKWIKVTFEEGNEKAIQNELMSLRI